MPNLTTIDPETILTLCQDNLPELGRSLTQYYGSAVQLKTGELTSWDADRSLEGIKGGGHLLSFLLGEECLLAALPNLPVAVDADADTLANDDDALEALANEWSQILLPSEFSADHIAVLSVENVAELITAADPLSAARVIDLAIHPSQEAADADSENETATDNAETTEESENAEANEGVEEPLGKVHIIWPVQRHLDLQAVQRAEAAAMPSMPPAPVRPMLSPQVRRLMKLPVSVVVRLAEKRMEIGQLRGLNSGSLIKFNKSCEDLLELYVNNQPYCRGEAVKIGEKFGLKVIEVGCPAPPRNGVYQ